MRKLDKQFLEDLKEGKLKKLLQMVKADDTLCLEIRENYINIYYRGGSLLKVKKDKEEYTYEFDRHYCINNSEIWDTFDPRTLITLEEYFDKLPLLKREMDHYFTVHPKLEREYEQLVLHDNNITSLSYDTDYYISDMEYADSAVGSRFDMTGIKWASTIPSRRYASGIQPVIFEIKYGDGALIGKAGIKKHFEDLKEFLESNSLETLRKEIEVQFNQKVALGLIKNVSKEITINKFAKPEYILILANHKPASEVMKRELKEVLEEYSDLTRKIEVKLACANLMGAGLFKENMVNLSDACVLETTL